VVEAVAEEAARVAAVAISRPQPPWPRPG